MNEHIIVIVTVFCPYYHVNIQVDSDSNNDNDDNNTTEYKE